MSTKPKLTSAQLSMLNECANYALNENYGGSGYVRLGGHGYSPLRRDYRVRKALVDLGLITWGSVIQATESGKEYLKAITPPVSAGG